MFNELRDIDISEIISKDGQWLMTHHFSRRAKPTYTSWEHQYCLVKRAIQGLDKPSISLSSSGGGKSWEFIYQ